MFGGGVAVSYERGTPVAECADVVRLVKIDPGANGLLTLISEPLIPDPKTHPENILVHGNTAKSDRPRPCEAHANSGICFARTARGYLNRFHVYKTFVKGRASTNHSGV